MSDVASPGVEPKVCRVDSGYSGEMLVSFKKHSFINHYIKCHRSLSEKSNI